MVRSAALQFTHLMMVRDYRRRRQVEVKGNLDFNIFFCIPTRFFVSSNSRRMEKYTGKSKLMKRIFFCFRTRLSLAVTWPDWEMRPKACSSPASSCKISTGVFILEHHLWKSRESLKAVISSVEIHWALRRATVVLSRFNTRSVQRSKNCQQHRNASRIHKGKDGASKRKSEKEFRHRKRWGRKQSRDHWKLTFRCRRVVWKTNSGQPQ